MPDLPQLQKVLLAGILSEIRTGSGSDRVRALDSEDRLDPLAGFVQMVKPLFQMKHSYSRKTATAKAPGTPRQKKLNRTTLPSQLFSLTWRSWRLGGSTVPLWRRYLLAIFLFPLLLVCCSTPSANAQQPDDVVRTETSLVQLNVGVVDPRGRAVTSLSQNDFTVYEDGVKQPILHFEPTYAPFSLVLLLDTSGSTVNFRQQFKQAAWRFLDALAPEDRVAVIQFNAKVKSLAGFSTDRKKTAYAIQIADGAGETHFYEALKYALKELDKEGDKRRKAIVVMTDGLDTQLRNSDRASLARVQTDQEAINAIDAKASGALNTVLTAADRQGVSIYPLALPSGDPKRLPLRDPVITGIYSAARTRLQSLADRTGGRLNDIRSLDQMARLYAEVAAELRALYTVAYQARGERARDGKWHAIKIEVGRAELIVRTKPGYYSR